MIILYNSSAEGVTGLVGAWREAFQRLDPAVDLRVWPETGPVEDVEFVLAWRPQPGDLRRYPNLKAIFSLGAGVDGLIDDATLPPGVPIVRMVDKALTAGMTEYVVLHVLRHHRRMPELAAQQRAHVWEELASPPTWERKVGLLGLGVLGADAAAKLNALGFDVAGWSRSRKDLPEVAAFSGAAGFAPFLARTEILVCLLPLTAGTAGILDARAFAALPRGASVINAARGGHLVEPDLLAALDGGHLSHATLDVFAQEPLPPNHPFWDHPRITVTPHNASTTQPATAAVGILDNIRRLRAGQPLAHTVDLANGY